MTNTGIVLFIIGLFVLFNAGNIVGVLQGNTKLNFAGGGAKK